MMTLPAHVPIPFVILRELVPGAAERWQAAHPTWSIAAWGPLWLGLPEGQYEAAVRHSGDGRAVGVFDGVVLNDQEVLARWQARGQPLPAGDHRQLAIEELAAHGPRGLVDLRWHGSVAVLHRAQGVALLARDPLGVGWLGHAVDAELQVFTSDPRLDATAVQAVPPGVALRVDAKGCAAQLVRVASEHLPYFRDIPDELRQGDDGVLRRGLAARLRAAVEAHERGWGELALAELQLAQFSNRVMPLPGNSAAVWSPVGWDSLAPAEWPEVEPWLRPGPWPAVEPPEPLNSADPVDRRARVWRATVLADRELRSVRAAALDRGEWLAVPHLDPAVLAWLGGIERARRIEMVRAT